MSKKGQKRIISLLNFWHAAKKAVLFILFFEGSLTIFFLSLSQRCKNAKNKINFPTNEEPHHNEQTTTRKTREMMAKTTTPLSPRGQNRRRRRLFFFHNNFHFLLLLSSSLLLFSTTPTMCLAFSSSSASSHRFHPSEDELSRVHSAKFISCPG
jgi:hypothetical protein